MVVFCFHVSSTGIRQLINMLAIIGEITVQKIDLANGGGMMFGFRGARYELPSPSFYSTYSQCVSILSPTGKTR
jgi:hypothetical protein